MFKKSLVIALALLAAIGCTSVSTHAQDHSNPSRQVLIGNGTPDIIAGIFARIAGKNEWTGNILEGEGAMPPGTQFGIDFTNDEQACNFDIKMVIIASDKVRELNLSAFDVCNNDTLKIIKQGGTPPGHPPVGGEPSRPAPSLNPPPRQFDI